MSDDSTDTSNAQTGAQADSTRRGRRLVAIIGVIAVIVLAVVLAGAIVGVSPLCSRCHTAQATSLAASPHAQTNCRACHWATGGSLASASDVAFRMLPAQVAGGALSSPGEPVGDSACLPCHRQMLTAGKISKNGLNINHTVCIVGTPCENCHGDALHGSAVRYVRTPHMADCIACHTKKHAPVDCTTCHSQAVASTVRSDPEWARVHGADWRKLHGTGDLRSCSACHGPTYCRRCHGVDYPHGADVGVSHGVMAANSGVAACYTCHKGQAYCDGCHGMPMPHPKGFLQVHASIAKTVNNPRCAVCHVVSDCVDCHTNHIHPGGSMPPVGKYGNG